MYAPVIKFLRHTGVRVEELCLLKKDLDDFSASITKAVKRKECPGQKSYLVVSPYLKSESAYRKVPLDGEAWDAIHEFETIKEPKHIKSDYVFCTGTGGLIEQRNILHAYHTALKKYNLPIRGLHSLRKLFCKNMHQLDYDWEKIRRLMGHESVAVTQKYYYDIN